MKESIKSLLVENFKNFKQVELINEIVDNSVINSFDNETILIDHGSYIKYIPFVTKGLVKVYKTNVNTNEVLLYYIKPGESCAVTLMSAFQNNDSKVKAVATKGSEIIFCPTHIISRFYNKFPTWQEFVVNTFDLRFGEVLELIDNVCFRNLDQRLASYLINKTKLTNSNILKISHADIAADLNSSREVISRLLKKLVERDVLSLNRGEVTISNMSDLRHLV